LNLKTYKNAEIKEKPKPFLNRRTEWEAWERTLRMANFRKRRFLEVLDRLSSRPIIES